jgi:eukaryotic-like serine/threonine-protein kinase
MMVGHSERYVLGECLRRTGWGTVHSAFDSQLSREVVLKTVEVDGDSAQRQAREAALLAGARAAARLNHPNIVTVHDAGSSERGVFIATELLAGRDLRSRLADGWRPDPPQVTRIAARIAQALSHAHGANVVHGRVEPANVFMIGRTQLKVLNFGVAGAIAGLEANCTDRNDRTDGAEACDRASRVAPERLLGEAIHARGDVYGLGLVMYEMLAGRPAFSGDSLEEVHRAVLHVEVAAVHALNPAVPVALSTIVACAMARNPAMRYESAQHMLDALRVYGSDAAEAAARAARSQGGMQRAVAMLAVIAASGLGVVALRGVPTYTPRPVQASAPVAQPNAPVAPASASVVSAASAAAAAAAAAPAPAPATAPTASAAPAVEPLAPVARAASEGNGAAPGTAALASGKRPVQRAAIKAPKARPPITTARPTEVERSPVNLGNERPSSVATPAAPTAAAPTSSAASSAATPRGRGAINFAIEPRGQVEVNGVPIGPTPPMLRLTLPNGSYTITVRNEGFPAYSIGVVVSDDKPVNINHRFGP